jgi:5-formyltetrahydrofolate cyclo-ligase
MYSTNKSDIRKYIRKKKREYSSEELEALSLPVLERVLKHPKVIGADTILLYYSLPDEVCTHNLIDILYNQGKHIFLPKVVSPTEMTLCEYLGHDSLTSGAYGIMEPDERNKKQDSSSKFSTLNCALIPGVAFDSQGFRLGRGKGYYDRLLAKLLPADATYKIGLCFPFQLLSHIPHETHDIPMDEIISQ